MTMEMLFKLVVIFFAALATGGLIVNWIGLARAMSRLSSGSAYVEFHQATNKTFDPYMPIVVVGALLGGIFLAIFSSGIRSVPGQLAIAGVPVAVKNMEHVGFSHMLAPFGVIKIVIRKGDPYASVYYRQLWLYRHGTYQ